MKPPTPTERQVQRSILAMIGLRFPDVFVTHIPNGAHLGGDNVARFKQMGALKGDGLKSGFPDLSLYWNHGHCLIEVKRPGYTPSSVRPEQVKVHALLAEMGFAPAICSSPEEAYAFLIDRGAPCRLPWRDAA